MFDVLAPALDGFLAINTDGLEERVLQCCSKCAIVLIDGVHWGKVGGGEIDRP